MGQKIAKFFRDYKSEFKKIVWPTWPQVVRNTSIVLVFVVTAALCIGILDFAFSRSLLWLSTLI